MTAQPIDHQEDAFDPEGGFTISWRRKWNNPVFRKKLEVAVWDWMCDTAQWEATRIPTQFGPAYLNRGEVMIAERVLADEFGMHRNTLRALLQRLVDEGMITLIRDRIPHRAGTVVHITKYEEYQSFANVRRYLEDRKAKNVRTEAGPKEDRSGTKNKELNTLKKEESYVASAVPALTVVGYADVCVPSVQGTISTAASADQQLGLPIAQTPAKPKTSAAKKPLKFAAWMSESWSRFKAEYPSRGMANPNKAGQEAFAHLLLKGIDAEELIASAKAYDAQITRAGKVGTSSVKHYATFLNYSEEFWKQVLEEETQNVHSNVHPLRPGQNRPGTDNQPRKPRIAGVMG